MYIGLDKNVKPYVDIHVIYHNVIENGNSIYCFYEVSALLRRLCLPNFSASLTDSGRTAPFVSGSNKDSMPAATERPPNMISGSAFPKFPGIRLP